MRWCRIKYFFRRNFRSIIRTGLVIGGLDILHQAFYDEKCIPNEIDFKRTAQVAAAGTVLAGPLVAYLLERHPSIVRSGVNAGVILAAGELFTKAFIEDQPIQRNDLKRAVEMFCAGAFVLGPLLGAWYKILHIYINPCPRFAAVFKKWLADQVVFMPIYLAIGAGTIYWMQNKDVSQELSDRYKDILMCAYKIMPLVQLLNFACVPLDYQVFVFLAALTSWSIYNAERPDPNAVQS